jgi:hypothetical protein
MWLYSFGYTKTRKPRSLRRGCDEPTPDTTIARRMQGTRGDTGWRVCSTPDPARPCAGRTGNHPPPLARARALHQAPQGQAAHLDAALQRLRQDNARCQAEHTRCNMATVSCAPQLPYCPPGSPGRRPRCRDAVGGHSWPSCAGVMPRGYPARAGPRLLPFRQEGTQGSARGSRGVRPTARTASSGHVLVLQV